MDWKEEMEPSCDKIVILCADFLRRYYVCTAVIFVVHNLVGLNDRR